MSLNYFVAVSSDVNQATAVTSMLNVVSKDAMIVTTADLYSVKIIYRAFWSKDKSELPEFLNYAEEAGLSIHSTKELAVHVITNQSYF